MARSAAKTVDQYLAELPPDRRAVVEPVRNLVRRHLPKGYAETMNWGMISYEIPLERYPDTYNGQPLGYVAIAAQKNYVSLYLMGAYADPASVERLNEAFRSAGKRLDMGKSCIRFRTLDDLPGPQVFAELVESITPERYIALYEASRRR
jgi:hypothetical protein